MIELIAVFAVGFAQLLAFDNQALTDR